MILGNGHDESLDVWGLGVLMFELLHGVPPFSPPLKLKDRREQLKVIEKNILSSNINFRKDLSVEAIGAMKIMMNPKKNERPFAKDINKLEFFREKNI